MPQPRKAARTAAEADPADERDEQLRQHLAQLGDLLATGLVLTPGRVQEAFDDAVRRGRLIRQDAEDLARALVILGRQQADELLAPLESLAAPATRKKAHKAPKGDPKAGVLPSEPFPGYTGMAAAEVVRRVAGLTPAQLRKLRDHEAGGSNRKTVLRAVDKRLA
jgi:hypothetical protein